MHNVQTIGREETHRSRLQTVPVSCSFAILQGVPSRRDAKLSKMSFGDQSRSLPFAIRKRRHRMADDL